MTLINRFLELESRIGCWLGGYQYRSSRMTVDDGKVDWGWSASNKVHALEQRLTQLEAKMTRPETDWATQEQLNALEARIANIERGYAAMKPLMDELVQTLQEIMILASRDA